MSVKVALRPSAQACIPVSCFACNRTRNLRPIELLSPPRHGRAEEPMLEFFLCQSCEAVLQNAKASWQFRVRLLLYCCCSMLSVMFYVLDIVAWFWLLIVGVPLCVAVFQSQRSGSEWPTGISVVRRQDGSVVFSFKNVGYGREFARLNSEQAPPQRPHTIPAWDRQRWNVLRSRRRRMRRASTG